MCLRQSPSRTAAFLKANRHNCQFSTGPRTRRGKARASLNALKHGGYARQLGERLAAAGDRSGAALYAQVCEEIAGVFGVSDRAQVAKVERLANSVLALARRAGVLGTKPECPLLSERLGPRSMAYSRFAIHDMGRRIGLVYWVQRRGYWTREKVYRALLSRGPTEEPTWRESLEHRMRRRVFRLRRPSLWQWQAYCLSRKAGRRRQGTAEGERSQSEK